MLRDDGMGKRKRDVPQPDDHTVMVIVLDTNPVSWCSSAAARDGRDAATSLRSAMDQLLLFVNAFTALKDRNHLAVIACQSDRTCVASTPSSRAHG